MQTILRLCFHVRSPPVHRIHIQNMAGNKISANPKPGFLIIFARLSDIFGRKLALLSALTLFTVFSLACGVAQTTEQLYVQIKSRLLRQLIALQNYLPRFPRCRRLRHLQHGHGNCTRNHPSSEVRSRLRLYQRRLCIREYSGPDHWRCDYFHNDMAMGLLFEVSSLRFNDCRIFLLIYCVS